MIERAVAEAFAAEWVAAWNSHDLDRILAHYTDDFSFASPLIPLVTGEASGRLQGKAAIRAYWAAALARRPDLRFELVEVFTGVDSLVIRYRRHDGRPAAEYFEFDATNGVVRSSAHYASL